MTCALVILAAGASTRMGSPKALSPVGGGERALERLVRVAREAGLARPIVVLGADHDAVRAQLGELDAAFVRNPAPEAGRTGSLQRGLAATGASCALALPVDHPLVAASTLAALAAAAGEWVVPTFEGRGGHPIKLGPMGVAAVMSAPATTPLRHVPRMVGIEPHRLAVRDPGILLNLDTPDALQRAVQGAASDGAPPKREGI